MIVACLAFILQISPASGQFMENGLVTNFLSVNANQIGDVAVSPDDSYALFTNYVQHAIREAPTTGGSGTVLAGKAGTSGYLDGVGTNSNFNFPAGVDISPDNSFALIADHNNNVIRKIVLSTADVTTFAGQTTSGSSDGVGTSSSFNAPYDVAISSDGTFALVADTGNQLIRKIIISTQAVTTFAGQTTSGASNGIGSNAKFNAPISVGILSDNSYALIADANNHLIRKIRLSNALVTRLSGQLSASGSSDGIGTNAIYDHPSSIAISPDDSYALITDSTNDLIRQIVLSTSAVTTVAGVANSAGGTNGYGTNALFNQPTGIDFSADGTFALIADTNGYIRKITAVPPPTESPTLAPI